MSMQNPLMLLGAVAVFGFVLNAEGKAAKPGDPVILKSPMAGPVATPIAKMTPKPKPSSKPWFKAAEFKSVEMKQYKSMSNRKVIAAVGIDQVIGATSWARQIAELPSGKATGKLGPNSECIELIFTSATGTETIQVLDKRFKTPEGGFYAEKNADEAALYKTIVDLLNPQRPQ